MVESLKQNQMKIRDLLISIIVIGIIVFIPHIGILPNFLYSAPILIIVWLALKYFGENFSNLGFAFKSLTPKTLLAGTLTAILIVSFMQLVFFPIVESFFVFDETEVELYDFIKESKWNFGFILIMAWLIGGFYEEIVFHGFIFSRLEKMFLGKYSTHISFIITSLIFGAYHIQLGAAGTINALLVGAGYLGIFLYFKRNLWYSIICHGVYNTIVITMIYMGYL